MAPKLPPFPPDPEADEAPELFFRRLKLTDRRDITRVARVETGTYLWTVRISYKGQIISQSFRDRAHGSTTAALKAAVAWRDEQRRQFPYPKDRPKVEKEPRLVRYDQPWLSKVGWYAYPADDRPPRYFADGKHGGWAKARARAVYYLEGKNEP